MRSSKIKRFALLCFLLVLVTTLFTSSAGAASETPSNQKIRVGLCYGSSASSSYTFTTSSSGFEYGYSTGKEFVKTGETSVKTIKVTSSGNYKVTLSDGSGNTITTYTNSSSGNFAFQAKNDGLTRVSSPSRSELNYDYYGFMEFMHTSSTSSSMKLINVLDFELYTKCVLPCELSASYPMEALKAQAVCIRSLATADYTQQRHGSHVGFNVCNTTDCQAYYGNSNRTVEKNRLITDAAVDATKGQVMIYVGSGSMKGKTIEAIYHSASGGSTISASSQWGGSSMPYCAAVRVPEETSYPVWGATITLDDIYAVTKSSDFNSSTAWKKAIYSLGKIKSMEIIATDNNSDHVYMLRLTDVDGESYTMTTGERVYYFIHRLVKSQTNNYSSTNFTLTALDPSSTSIGVITAEGEQVISSSQQVAVMTGSGKETYSLGTSTTVITENGKQSVSLTSSSGYRVSGKGYSHGVGLSQKGASDMAKNYGYDYETILHKFYTNVSITTLSDIGFILPVND